jgi:hypothetical protein
VRERRDQRYVTVPAGAALSPGLSTRALADTAHAGSEPERQPEAAAQEAHQAVLAVVDLIVNQDHCVATESSSEIESDFDTQRVTISESTKVERAREHSPTPPPPPLLLLLLLLLLLMTVGLALLLAIATIASWFVCHH